MVIVLPLKKRQIRAALGKETPYSAAEIDDIINILSQTTGNVARIQQNRLRYWVLKYLEKCIGQKEEAIVLMAFKKNYRILLPH